MKTLQHLLTGPRVWRSLLSLLMILAMAGGGLPNSIPSSSAAILPQQTQAVSIKGYVASDFSPHLKASYGEVLTYTIQFTVTQGSSLTQVTLQDSFGDHPNYLRVDYIDGSATLPIPQNGDTPPCPGCTFNSNERDGHPLLTWGNLPDMNPTGNPYVYRVRYSVIVYWDQIYSIDRQAISTASLIWSGGSASAPSVTVTLVQPWNFNFYKTQQLPPRPPYEELDPGDRITWTLTLYNAQDVFQGTAYDLRITDTMPTRTTYQGYRGAPPSSQVGRYVYWNIPSLTVGAMLTTTIFASLPLTGNVAHGPIQNQSQMLRSSAPGAVPQERVYRPAAESTTTAYVRNILVGKSQYSKSYPGNNQYQAVAGEYVTSTVAVTVPQGIIIYNPILRIYLEDGLEYKGLISCTPDIGLPIITTTTPYWPYTQLEWQNIDSIVDTDNGPSSIRCAVLGQARQQFFIPGHVGEVYHGATLRVGVLVRWSNNPATDPQPYDPFLVKEDFSCNQATGNCTQFLRPDLHSNSPTDTGSQFEHSFTEGQFEGGTGVRFTLHLRNRNEWPIHPPAYETALTDTLGAGLTYVSASPAPDHVEAGPGNTTILRWDVLPTIGVYPAEQTIIITATLPVTMVAGQSFTTTAQARYSTFAGSVTNEGVYVDRGPQYTAQDTVFGGYTVAKQVHAPHPPADLYIGDYAVYTVSVTLNPGLVMYRPQFEDLMPQGFRYITGSMYIVGGTPLGEPWNTAQGDGRWILHWNMLDINNLAGSQPLVVQIVYRAYQTGRNSLGQYTYANGQGDFQGRPGVQNVVNECWHTTSNPSSPTRCLPTNSLPNAWVWIDQPWLADPYYWVHTRTDLPQYDFEVGDTVNYLVQIKNTGQGPAFDLVVTETLPVGLSIMESHVGCEPEPGGTCEVKLNQKPPVGATGLVTWVIDQLYPQETVLLYYSTRIGSSIRACSAVTATIRLDDYSSQPGSPIYDRHYKWFNNAFGPNPDPIPLPKEAPYIRVVGVCLEKSDSPDPVHPGETLHYRLEFGNTSHTFGATQVRITDTYDVNTELLNYDVSDLDIHLIGWYTPTRTIVWGLDTLPANGHSDDYYITIDFMVNLPFNQVDNTLTNYAAIDGRGDRVGRVERWENTRVRTPFLSIEKSATPSIVSPGGLITYTLTLRNLGDLLATNVQLDEFYDSHVDYVSADPPPTSGNSRWTFASLGISATQTIRVTVRVDKPLPPDLVKVGNRATARCTEVYGGESNVVWTDISRPVLAIGTKDIPDPVDPGASILYTISYTNTTIAANSVMVTNTLDPYVTFTYANPSPIGNSCPGGVCRWSLGNLPPLAHGQILLSVQVASSIPPQVSYLENDVAIASAEVQSRHDKERTCLSDRPCTAYKIYLPLVFKSWP